jgi:hypothetical protein
VLFPSENTSSYSRFKATSSANTNPPCEHGQPSKIVQVRKDGKNKVRFHLPSLCATCNYLIDSGLESGLSSPLNLPWLGTCTDNDCYVMYYVSFMLQILISTYMYCYVGPMYGCIMMCCIFLGPILLQL